MELRDIQHLATLARLDIPVEEQEALLHDMTAIIGYIDQITKAPVGVATGGVPEHRNVFREDTVTNVTGAQTEALLAEVPETQDGFVKVKKILG
jgi:aspartyl-tRNA(Asn)/glutamyl-tRNA(Gln) amidotransferase subunit C